MHTSARATAAAAPAVSAPAIQRQAFSNNFLADVRIDYGPRDLFARLFLRLGLLGGQLALYRASCYARPV